jgi:hypothetical protein
MTITAAGDLAAAGLSPVAADIVNSAALYGVDPRLALSIAQHESGLDPTAVGDSGTSFGLFQLHQGGELGGLSSAQAFNPIVNANTALAVVANVAKTNPGGDPGAIAAAAQRPADPAAYAAAVDAIYTNPADFPQVPAAAGSGTPTATLTGFHVPSPGAIAGAVFGATPIGAGLSLFDTITGGIGSGVVKDVFKGALPLLLTITFVVAALGLILLGLTRLFPGVTRTVTTLPMLAA